QRPEAARSRARLAGHAADGQALRKPPTGHQIDVDQSIQAHHHPRFSDQPAHRNLFKEHCGDSPHEVVRQSCDHRKTRHSPDRSTARKVSNLLSKFLLKKESSYSCNYSLITTRIRRDIECNLTPRRCFSRGSTARAGAGCPTSPSLIMIAITPGSISMRLIDCAKRMSI